MKPNKLHSQLKHLSTFSALHNPQYKVPLHLIQMANEENIKLQKMRYKYTHICHNLSCLVGSQLILT